MDQAGAHGGVEIRAVERHLKAPILEIARGGGAFHRLELSESGIDVFVRQEWALPVALEGKNTLGEIIGEAFADEVAPIVAQNVLERGVGIPA